MIATKIATEKGCQISSAVRRIIFNYTAGHCGLVIEVLDFVVRENISNTGLEEMTKIITSPTFLRVTQKFCAYYREFDLEEQNFLKEMLVGPDNQSLIPGHEQGFCIRDVWDRKVVTRLLLLGPVMIQGNSQNYVEFPAPIFRSLLSLQLYPGLTGTFNFFPELYPFEELTVICLSHIRPEIIANAFNSNRDGRRILTMDFFNALVTAVAKRGLVTPFVGTTASVAGLHLDLHINSLEWGFEVLREGTLYLNTFVRSSGDNGAEAL
ncbi:hypothetical protein BDQ17DRAFT_1438105 [Cyathus striatus]|nr:hypothetical protein BDQ17DRAFT_1438105 [Cyathus striatus]